MQHMRLALFVVLAACGGSEPESTGTKLPAPGAAPAQQPAAKAPAPAEAPAAEAPAAAATDFASMDEAQQKTYLLELGEKVYTTGGSGGVACLTCHQANGEGLPPSFPPLKGAKDWMKDCASHAGYIINGLNGEIVVNGVTYNGVMPAQPNLSNEEIAAVISYERMSWGNDYGLCTPDQVQAAR